MLLVVIKDKECKYCMDYRSEICPEAKFVHILTITARQRDITHYPMHCFLKNLFSEERGSYGWRMSHRSHILKLGIKYPSKLLGFCS